MSKTIIIAEKPSVAKNIKIALEEKGQKFKYVSGAWKNDKTIIRNAVGHLLEIDSKLFEYGKPIVFSNQTKPIDYFKVAKGKNELFKDIKKDIKNCTHVINACDPDIEGELIFRTIIEKIGLKKETKISRIICKDQTPNGINSAFEKMENAENYEGQRQRGYARIFTDYSLGLNLSRQIKANVGRVMTPTLRLVVERDLEIENFVKSKVYTVDLIYKNILNLKSKKLEFSTQNEAELFCINEEDKFEYKITRKTTNPEKLFDLAALQKKANKDLNLSPSKTLEIAQKLYTEGYITYPRTDCRIITEETLKKSSLDMKAEYVVGKPTAHEAIIITDKELKNIDTQEGDIYKIIKKRCLANTKQTLKFEELKIEIGVHSQTFNFLIEDGFNEIENAKMTFETIENKEMILSVIEKITKIDFSITPREVEKKPKSRYNEAALLSKMQNINSKFDHKELEIISKEIEGIGTPATRGAIIEKLIKIGFLEKSKKNIISSKGSRKLILDLQSRKSVLSDYKTTAQFEKTLSDVDINRSIITFIQDLEELNRTEISKVHDYIFMNEGESLCPKCGTGIMKERKTKTSKFYGCSNYPNCKHTKN